MNLAKMTGLQLLQSSMEGKIPFASMASLLNFRLISVSDGEAVFEGTSNSSMCNPLGTVHGGWALTLIDSAAGCAAHTTLAAGVGYTTLETKANFVKTIQPNGVTVRAIGRVLSRGRRVITAQALVHTLEGVLVAHGTSTLLVLEGT